MKTEKEIREALAKDIQKHFPRKEALIKIKSLDTHLDILMLAEQDGIDAPEAWEALTKAVQEPDPFWDWCLLEAEKVVPLEKLDNMPAQLLFYQIATRLGVDALREAYKAGY